jgi:hypothetical protein
MPVLRIQISCLAVLAGVLVLSSTAATAVETERQSEMILTWGRYGGFAGFCDEMQVAVSGEVRIQSCRPKSEKVGKLSSDDLKRLGEWRTSFGSVVIESKDGAVADGMSVMLTLKGTGAGQPTATQRREILEWAERVYGRTKA